VGLGEMSERLAAKLTLQAQESQLAMAAAMREVSQAHASQQQPEEQAAGAAGLLRAHAASSSSFAGIRPPYVALPTPRANEDKQPLNGDDLYEKICMKLMAQQELSNEEQRIALRGELECIYKRQNHHLKEEIQGLYAKVAGSMATQTQIEEVRLAVASVARQSPGGSGPDGMSVADTSSPRAEDSQKNRWCLGSS